MKAIPEEPSVAVIGAASGTGRAKAIDVVVSSADALPLADLKAAGLKRISERLPALPASRRARALRMAGCTTGMRLLRPTAGAPALCSPLQREMPKSASRRGSGIWCVSKTSLRSSHDAERLDGGGGWDAKCRHLHFCRKRGSGDRGEAGRLRRSHCACLSRCCRECRHRQARGDG